jgi:hypothetical protein
MRGAVSLLYWPPHISLDVHFVARKKQPDENAQKRTRTKSGPIVLSRRIKKQPTLRITAPLERPRRAVVLIEDGTTIDS